MDEETVTVGDTEVTIEETADGFAVTEATPVAGTVEKLKEDMGVSEGDSTFHGSIGEFRRNGPDKVRIYCNNSGHDAFDSVFDELEDSSWILNKVEFDLGYVEFIDTEA